MMRSAGTARGYASYTRARSGHSTSLLDETTGRKSTDCGPRHRGFVGIPARNDEIQLNFASRILISPEHSCVISGYN